MLFDGNRYLDSMTCLGVGVRTLYWGLRLECILTCSAVSLGVLEDIEDLYRCLLEQEICWDMLQWDVSEPALIVDLS